MKTLVIILMMVSTSYANQSEVKELKQRILDLARSYEGLGDPDFSKQKTLDPLVQRLVALRPQPPIGQRVELLKGVWKQVWGPYNYNDDSRTVDPDSNTDEIYQVVFDGFYYNVTPVYKNGDRNRERIGLLKGVYRFSNEDANTLEARFIKFPGTRVRPDFPIWKLAALEEAGTLPQRFNVVNPLIVRLFFGGGQLNEVYTDHDLRITYGSDGGSMPAIYVLERIKN